MSLSQIETGGVVFEPQSDISIVVNIPGRYSLSSRRDSSGERRVYACRAVSLSPSSITLIAPVVSKIGERVIAQIQHLGKLHGPICRLLEQGFVMRVAANREERSRLAARIAWLDSHKNHDLQDRRTDERTAPANPHSKLILADGSIETCFVIDLSVSGAAVSADTVPGIGTVLAVGSVVGRVVRHFSGGFAVHFVERQSRDTVETMVILGA